jgi:hypothetical protein
VCDGYHVFNRSKGTANGTVYVTGPNQSTYSQSWAVGPEDLACSDGTTIWSLGEHPGNRIIFHTSVPH